MPTASLPAVTNSQAYENDLITKSHTMQRGFMKVPEGPGLGIELDGDAVQRYRHTEVPLWPRHISVVSRSGGIKHYYRERRQPEALLKLGVDDAFSPGIRIDEWKDDGSEDFNKYWKPLQHADWPIWEP